MSDRTSFSDASSLRETVYTRNTWGKIRHFNVFVILIGNIDTISNYSFILSTELTGGNAIFKIFSIVITTNGEFLLELKLFRWLYSLFTYLYVIFCRSTCLCRIISWYLHQENQWTNVPHGTYFYR